MEERKLINTKIDNLIKYRPGNGQRNMEMNGERIVTDNLREMIDRFESHLRKKKNNKKRVIGDNEINDTMNERIDTMNMIEGLKTGEISIGDLAMEQLISLFGEINFKQQPTPAKIKLKKDYITFIINDPDSDLIRYSVYALLVGATTSVLDVSFKKNLDLPILIYTETIRDPSDIIESVYFFEVQQHRTVFIRRFIKQQNNAARITPLTILKHTEKRYDLFFTGDVIVEDVDQDLIDLEIIIRNQAYISTTPFETLLNMIVILTSF